MTILFCQPQGEAEFNIHPGQEPATGFRELGHYQFSVEYENLCTFLIDDVELFRSSVGERHSWEWQPKFYAGVVVAELYDMSNRLLASYQLDVAPEPTKLGREMFKTVVDQLFSAEPRMLFGSEAAHHAIGFAGDISNPHLEYARLKMFGPILLRAFHSLRRQPLTSLRHDREYCVPHLVKRLDHHSLRSITNSPFSIALLKDLQSLGESEHMVNTRFNVPRSREEFDTPAHRTLMSVLQSVIQRVRAVTEALTKIAATEKLSWARTAMGPRMDFRIKFLSELEVGLRRMTMTGPFSMVTRREVTSAGLNVISGHPSYARAFRSGWRILRPGLLGDRSDEMLPMSPSWEIYERWCFIQIHRALQLSFPDLEWSKCYPSTRDDNIVFKGYSASMSVEAHCQPRFPAKDQARKSGFWSISGERYPDIVLICTTAEVRRMLVFDAKYRVRREHILDAMSSAHIYHDSLRWNGSAPNFSLLLVPAGGGAPWLETEEFQAEHSVGVIPLSPATELNDLAKLLKARLCLG